MKVLIACEESQEVTKAFRLLGHEAYSCDLQDCSGGHPEWHIKDDIRVVRHHYGKWDLRISFPPCTDLSVSGARWFPEKREDGTQAESILFFLQTWYNSDALENPIGIMNDGGYVNKWFPKLYELAIDMGFPFKPSQIIQPWMFGDGEKKATCLWLRNLPPLQWSNAVTLFYGKTSTSERKESVWRMPPGPERSKQRSKTFPGIAKAMAEQWGKLKTDHKVA